MEEQKMSKGCFEVTTIIDDLHYWYFFENVTAMDVVKVIESSEFSSVCGKWLSFTHSIDESAAGFSRYMKEYMKNQKNTVANIVSIVNGGFAVEAVEREM